MRSASVIVRCKNKVSTIDRTIASLRRQTVPVEIVAVDSGSTDGTREVVDARADKVITLRPEQFTYGGALNRGAEAAAGKIQFAVSAHCTLPRDDWVEIAMQYYAQLDVAGTSGHVLAPSGAPLTGTYFQTIRDLDSNPRWGFSNHASSWRREVWEQCPFDETMIACEDKQWMWRVVRAGWTIAYDPRLYVAFAHRRRQGIKALYGRSLREGYEFGRYGHVTMPDRRTALRQWWELPPGSSKPSWLRRLNYFRIVELWGQHMGERAGDRSGRPAPPTQPEPPSRSTS